MKVDRSTLLGLLVKLGAPHSSKISMDRAVKKLERFIHKSGIPDDLAKKEKDLLEELGLLGDAPEPEEEQEEQPEEEQEEQEEQPEEEEPTETAPKKKAKKAKKPKKDSTPKPKRVDFICRTISSIPKKGLKVEELAERANSDFAAAGGKDNLKQTLHHTRVLVPAAVAWGIAEVKDGSVFKV